MIKQALILPTVGLLLMLLASCSTPPKPVVEDTDLVTSSYAAAEALLQNAQDIRIFPNKPILVASFANIDDVRTSSSFGRMVAEQIGSRIAQGGFKVIELKLRNSVFVKEQTGELLLSREVQDISAQHDATAVVVGTYAESKRVVYVTAKLVRAKDSVILASYDYSLPAGPDTKQLLHNKQR